MGHLFKKIILLPNVVQNWCNVFMWNYWVVQYDEYLVSTVDSVGLVLQHIYALLNKAVINSLAPRRSEFNSKDLIFSLVLLIDIFISSHDNAIWWMPQDLTDDKSTLVQVMAWCHQATSHYLSKCWLSFLSPYGIARPQWVNSNNALLPVWC